VYSESLVPSVRVRLLPVVHASNQPKLGATAVTVMGVLGGDDVLVAFNAQDAAIAVR